jgi:hypothetical protein
VPGRLDILRGASQLAHPYAAHLSQLLQEEGRAQELAWVEALVGCLSFVVAAARGQITIAPPNAHTQDMQVSNMCKGLVLERFGFGTGFFRPECLARRGGVRLESKKHTPFPFGKALGIGICVRKTSHPHL